MEPPLRRGRRRRVDDRCGERGDVALGRLLVDAHGAAVFTGPYVLPGFDVGVGVDFPLGRAVLLGAYARYLHVVDDGPSFVNEDARVISGGVALTLRAPSPAE